MNTAPKLAAVALILFLMAACGNGDRTSKSSGSLSSLLPSDEYAGVWTNRASQREKLIIFRDGDGYVIEDEDGKKFAGTVHDGILSVSGPMGPVDALYAPSLHALVFAGHEFERTGDVATPAAMNDDRNAKRTMADMRTIATAWEARATDVNRYNAAGQQFTEPAYETAPAQLDSVLSPTYIKRMPREDGWGNPFDFRIDAPIGGAAAQTYEIHSNGRDGSREGHAYTAGTATDNYDCDIVYSNGTFIQWPRAAQQH
jgi:hypothetical protein